MMNDDIQTNAFKSCVGCKEKYGCSDTCMQQFIKKEKIALIICHGMPLICEKTCNMREWPSLHSLSWCNAASAIAALVKNTCADRTQTKE
mmetsp:Transcript_22505/g.41886  ORF Transcript_22505/g.41886 Transcript_22505/m.41886 type:complete len:90 (-) Transcript_22505:4-273(-)